MDLYNSLGINKYTKEVYFLDNYSAYHNEKGCRLIASYLANTIKKIYYRFGRSEIIFFDNCSAPDYFTKPVCKAKTGRQRILTKNVPYVRIIKTKF